MRNIIGVSLQILNPNQVTHRLCWWHKENIESVAVGVKSLVEACVLLVRLIHG